MHPRTFSILGLSITSALLAQPSTEPGPPVPVVIAPASANPAVEPATGGQQRLYRPGETLVPPEKAQAVVDEFRGAYERLNRPRLVIYVNRELVESRDGLRLSGRTERVETERDSRTSTHAAPPAGTTPQTQVNVAVSGSAGAGSSATYGPGESSGQRERVTADNTYEKADAPAASLADRQTVRDVERLFGRPLRIAGAQLADQRVVASLIADQPLDRVLAQGGSESARKDREALARAADVVIEILISSRNLTIPGYQGSEVRAVPDIQATAIRLADGAILGQASATDVLGRDRYAGPIVRQFDVRDIAEATALALMEDMAVTAPPGS
ncbi:MAG TPA: hypothetical protein VHF69_10625 [Candidatus Synoicihabitans sp.]|nr:hypothetical protein [Candidatus Synoicihabitans sp.]